MPLLFGNSDLSSKEWAITALVFQGCTNAQIAAETRTTEHVVETHLRRILDKTGCWNRTEIALWYLRMGVEKERRLYDRREAAWEISDERRKVDRRRLLARSPRANERHEINLEE
jgi:DNA-binding CsgD family transcriptional regulator